MSMYGMVLGDGNEQDRGQLLVSILNLTDGVPRYRDCWTERDEQGQVRMALYTRVGGGNRQDYETQILSMQASPFYLGDADDTFDSTYATFYFRIPTAQELLDADVLEATAVAAYEDTVKILEENAHPEPVDMGELWKEAIDALKTIS